MLASCIDYVFPLHSVKALRLLRMLRIIRLLHSFPALRAVVESLVVAFRNVVYLLFLIVLINFISAAGGMLLFREVRGRRPVVVVVDLYPRSCRIAAVVAGRRRR